MISVAMATYNGGKYIRKQLDSVLIQLSDEDELVISDDNSIDNTISIISEYQNIHSNILLYKNEKKGVTSNFNNALSHCRGDYIFICDQDDYWYPDKLKTVMKYFENNPQALLIMHDERAVNSSGEILKQSYRDRMRHGILRNFIKSSYYGHRIALRKELLMQIIPIPDRCKLYDQYIGLCAEMRHCSLFIDDILCDYIIHGDNFSKSKLSIIDRINVRFNLLSTYIIRD